MRCIKKELIGICLSSGVKLGSRVLTLVIWFTSTKNFGSARVLLKNNSGWISGRRMLAGYGTALSICLALATIA